MYLCVILLYENYCRIILVDGNKLLELILVKFWLLMILMFFVCILVKKKNSFVYFKNLILIFI